MFVDGGTSPSRLSSRSGTDGLPTVNTDASHPNCGRYLTNFVVRCTPAPPTGGNVYAMKSARRCARALEFEGGICLRSQHAGACNGFLVERFVRRGHPANVEILFRPDTRCL